MRITATTLNRMERATPLPPQLDIERTPDEFCALANISAAISLKRIADVVDRTERALRSERSVKFIREIMEAAEATAKDVEAAEAVEAPNT